MILSGRICKSLGVVGGSKGERQTIDPILKSDTSPERYFSGKRENGKYGICESDFTV